MIAARILLVLVETCPIFPKAHVTCVPAQAFPKANVMTTNDALPSHDKPAVSSQDKWFQRAFLLAIVMGCAVAMSPNPADPDLWGHVQYGRDVLTDGAIAETTTYSFTAEGYRWINHENLAELILAVGANTIGPVGFVVAKCLLSLLVILLIVRFAYQQGVHLLTVCVVALLVAVNAAFHWSVRPQLFTYTYFTLLIALLTWCFHGWKGKWHLPLWKVGGEAPKRADFKYSRRRIRYLWLAPILFLFWANTHGGFVAGYCIFTAYLVCRSIELLCRCGLAGLPVVRRFGLMIVVTGLATLVNPYGPGLHLWLLESLGTPRPEITEWHAPELFTLDSITLWLMIGLFGASILLSRRSRDFTHLVLLGITLWQSLEHLRHVPFFAILFGFWIPVHVESMFQRLRFSREDAEFGENMSPVMRRVMALGICLAFGLLIGRLYARLSDLRVDKSKYPVAAMQFIADHDMSGRMVVTYNWAQYAIAAFGPRSDEEKGIRVAFDGRFRTCYPQEIVDMNFDFVLGDGGPDRRHRSPESPPADGGRVLKFKNPDLVLISRGQPHSQQVMNEHLNTWVRLYQDKVAQVWGARKKYDDPTSPDFVRPIDRIIGDQEQEGFVTWPALPVRGRNASQLASN